MVCGHVCKKTWHDDEALLATQSSGSGVRMPALQAEMCAHIPHAASADTVKVNTLPGQIRTYTWTAGQSASGSISFLLVQRTQTWGFSTLTRHMQLGAPHQERSVRVSRGARSVGTQLDASVQGGQWESKQNWHRLFLRNSDQRQEYMCKQIISLSETIDIIQSLGFCSRGKGNIFN